MRTMSYNSLSSKQEKMLLKKGKIQNIGIIETVLVKHQGRKDGARGLPREKSPSVWDSPMIAKEWAAYEEFCNKQWGSTQIDLSALYEKLGVLTDQAKRLEEELIGLKDREPNKPTEDELNDRLDGEEELSKEQIRRRRSKEINARNSAYYARVTALRNKMEELYETMERIYHNILEANNATRIVCERVKNRLMQRRNIYWDNAYSLHPHKEKMPVCPPPLPEKTTAEALYISQHKSFEDEALQMMKRKTYLLNTSELISKRNDKNEALEEVA